MKLIVGEPGKPDGHIPPARLGNKLYDTSCKGAKNEENCRRNNLYKIDGLEINLFNITGIFILNQECRGNLYPPQYYVHISK